MPRPKSPTPPSYRHHKPSDQAVVTIDGKDVYLGKYDTEESREEYDRRIAEWLSNGRQQPPPEDKEKEELVIGDLMLAYNRHANAYYRKDGHPGRQEGVLRDRAVQGRRCAEGLQREGPQGVPEGGGGAGAAEAEEGRHDGVVRSPPACLTLFGAGRESGGERATLASFLQTPD